MSTKCPLDRFIEWPAGFPPAPKANSVQSIDRIRTLPEFEQRRSVSLSHGVRLSQCFLATVWLRLTRRFIAGLCTSLLIASSELLWLRRSPRAVAHSIKHRLPEIFTQFAKDAGILLGFALILENRTASRQISSLTGSVSAEFRSRGNRRFP
jgi:hypothetical protein